jgi:hypothetical protein
MNKSETNGYLRALELQLGQLVITLAELDRSGDFTPEAFEAFRAVRIVRIDLVNAARAVVRTRAFNAAA